MTKAKYQVSRTLLPQEKLFPPKLNYSLYHYRYNNKEFIILLSIFTPFEIIQYMSNNIDNGKRSS